MVSQPDTLQALHSAVHAYLATLLAISETLPDACPAVGRPHAQRLARLRTRLSFDSKKEALEAGTQIVRAELRDFAQKSAKHAEVTAELWQQAAQESFTLSLALFRRQGYFVSRLKDLARQMETQSYPEDPQAVQQAIAGQAAQIVSALDSMHTEAESMLARLQEQIRSAEVQLAQAAVVDRATGLMNRREIERRIEAQRSTGQTVVRLLFSITWEGGPRLTDAVMAQAAARVVAQSRPEDLAARWGDHELLVLFQSTPEIAARRSEQVAHSMTGLYYLEGGVAVEVQTTCQVLVDQPAEIPETV